MATKRNADKLTGRGSLAGALKRRRMAIEDGNLEEASEEFKRELNAPGEQGPSDDEADNIKLKRRRLGVPG